MISKLGFQIPSEIEYLSHSWYTEECGFEGVTCDHMAGSYTSGADVLSQYPSCKVSVGFLWTFGNGECHNFFNNEDCVWDAGDCIGFNDMYPGCKNVVVRPYWVGDTILEPNAIVLSVNLMNGDCVQRKINC